MRRLVILLVPLVLFAQDTNNDELIAQAYMQWNQYVAKAKEWTSQTNPHLISRHDKDLFKQMLKAERRMEGAFKQIGY